MEYNSYENLNYIDHNVNREVALLVAAFEQYFSDFSIYEPLKKFNDYKRKEGYNSDICNWSKIKRCLIIIRSKYLKLFRIQYSATFYNKLWYNKTEYNFNKEDIKYIKRMWVLNYIRNCGDITESHDTIGETLEYAFYIVKQLIEISPEIKNEYHFLLEEDSGKYSYCFECKQYYLNSLYDDCNTCKKNTLIYV